MTAIEEIHPAPWERHDWHGDLVSADGTATDDFTRGDVERIVAWGSTGDDWDGETAGIARLNDGRYIAWEASFGPTGDGFRCDAYGGESDIVFAANEETARKHLSERARELLQ